MILRPPIYRPAEYLTPANARSGRSGSRCRSSVGGRCAQTALTTISPLTSTNVVRHYRVRTALDRDVKDHRGPAKDQPGAGTVCRDDGRHPFDPALPAGLWMCDSGRCEHSPSRETHRAIGT
jgi:hypothetical protein